MQLDWPALSAATWQNAPRIPFAVDGTQVGSVAESNQSALSAWSRWLTFQDSSWHLVAPADERIHALATINADLRERGLIRAWRDEVFPLLDPQTGAALSRMERAACRFWGTLTRGAHGNGYVADAHGRPTHLWIARRARHKATDPGKRDNLIGGGVALGQTPGDALLREAWEEAGLSLQQMQGLQPGRTIRINCDVVEGRMVEDIHVFDLQLTEEVIPANQDGEVEEFSLLTIEQAADCAAGAEMTTDAALVTLDFLLRRGLLPRPAEDRLTAQFLPLLWPTTSG
jgi:8-oxo-dGTP pyrophosphatase MutT (NUDIX family)